MKQLLADWLPQSKILHASSTDTHWRPHWGSFVEAGEQSDKSFLFWTVCRLSVCCDSEKTDAVNKAETLLDLKAQCVKSGLIYDFFWKLILNTLPISTSISVYIQYNKRNVVFLPIE